MRFVLDSSVLYVLPTKVNFWYIMVCVGLCYFLLYTDLLLHNRSIYVSIRLPKLYFGSFYDQKYNCFNHELVILINLFKV